MNHQTPPESQWWSQWPTLTTHHKLCHSQAVSCKKEHIKSPWFTSWGSAHIYTPIPFNFWPLLINSHKFVRWWSYKKAKNSSMWISPLDLKFTNCSILLGASETEFSILCSFCTCAWLVWAFNISTLCMWRLCCWSFNTMRQVIPRWWPFNLDCSASATNKFEWALTVLAVPLSLENLQIPYLQIALCHSSAHRASVAPLPVFACQKREYSLMKGSHTVNICMHFVLQNCQVWTFSTCEPARHNGSNNPARDPGNHPHGTDRPGIGTLAKSPHFLTAALCVTCAKS